MQIASAGTIAVRGTDLLEEVRLAQPPFLTVTPSLLTWHTDVEGHQKNLIAPSSPVALAPHCGRQLEQRSVNSWARERPTSNTRHKARDKRKSFASMSRVWRPRQGAVASTLLHRTRDTQPLVRGDWGTSEPASPVRHLQRAAWRLIFLHFNSSSLIRAWRLGAPPNPLPNASVYPKAVQSLGHLLRRNYSLDEDKACLDLCYWARYHSPATTGSLSREPKVSVCWEWWISTLPAAGALQILNIYEPPRLRWMVSNCRGMGFEMCT